MSGLWAITCYFNPGRSARRRRNFATFRRRLGLPLIAVEWSHEGSFDLAGSDAEVLLRLRSPDLIWQKERLLNLAIAALPRGVDRVAWVDCDVVFARADWGEAAVRALDDAPLVQLFSRCHDLPKDAPDGVFEAASATSTAESFVSMGRRPDAEDLLFGRLWGSEPDAAGVPRRGRLSGLGWAARRDLLERHGLYDACILGAGDRAYACAAFGRQAVARQGWLRNARQREHYLRWAEPLAADVAARVGLVEGDVFHLWHGEIADRRYRERHAGLEAFGFDPSADLTLDGAGLWRWASDKPDMHRFVAGYFEQRRDDD